MIIKRLFKIYVDFYKTLIIISQRKLTMNKTVYCVVENVAGDVLVKGIFATKQEAIDECLSIMEFRNFKKSIIKKAKNNYGIFSRSNYYIGWNDCSISEDVINGLLSCHGWR